MLADQVDRAAVALEPRGTEIEHAVTLEALQVFARFRARQQHRVNEMVAGALVAEHLRKEDSLVDLEPVLVALQRVGLGRDLSGCRHKTRKRIGRVAHESSTRTNREKFCVSTA